MLFVMLNWLTSAASPVSLPASSGLGPFVTAFSPILLFVIPLTIAMYVNWLLEEGGGAESEEAAIRGFIERRAYRRLRGTQARIEARRAEKRRLRAGPYSRRAYKGPRRNRGEEEEQ